MLEQRSRCLPEPGALHLTRSEDLLDIDIEQPDLSIYERKGHDAKNNPQDQLEKNLKYLKLPFMRDQHQTLAKRASQKKWSHLDYFEKLADGEAALRRDHSVQRRIRLARFPVIKTLDQFNWTWPKDINRLQVQNLFRLQFVEQIKCNLPWRCWPR